MIVRRSAVVTFACLLILILLFAWQSSLCRAAGHLQTAANAPTLPMMDAGGVTVIGIVCDNLRDMPEDLRNQLFLPLPDALRDVPLTWTLTNAEGENSRKAAHNANSTKAKLQTADNVGTVRQANNRLIYTPPDEFNFNPEPERLRDVQRVSQRRVLLTVCRAQASGDADIIARQTIILARPPLVAVHGTNSNPASPTWNAKGRLIRQLQQMGIVVTSVNHGTKDFNYRNPLADPAREFYGNGPVEEGAERVAESVAQILQDTRQNQHLAIRRVDLLGYSYGGLIARWYLHQFYADPRAQNSVHWYVRAANTGAESPLYRFDAAWYVEQERQGDRETRRQGDREIEGVQSAIGNRQSAMDSSFILHPSSFAPPPVRKLITVASMWRGVPFCNYANEIHAPPDEKGQNPVRLANAPFVGHRIGEVLDSGLGSIVPTRVPAIEVMAVNSPWLVALNRFQQNQDTKPFVDTVAYGSVAGDDSGLFRILGSGARLDPYAVVRQAQTPSWFPYLALERHVDSDHNYSDGLVPLWSAVIGDNFDHFHLSRIVSANHDSILLHPRALEYVACALNNRAWLPSGRDLNSRWGRAITSRELASLPDATLPQNSPIPDYVFGPPQSGNAADPIRRVWTFQAGAMAPFPQDQLYPQIGLLGRIAPDALREIRTLRVEQATRNSAIVSWHTAAELNGFVTVTHWQQVNHGAYADVEVDCAPEPVGPRVTRDHRFRLSNLQPNTTYQVSVTSEAFRDPENIVAVSSELLRFTTKF